MERLSGNQFSKFSRFNFNMIMTVFAKIFYSNVSLVIRTQHTIELYRVPEFTNRGRSEEN